MNNLEKNAGVTADLGKSWSIEEVRKRALTLGKQFEPNPEIADRLGKDLASNDVIVLFNAEDVRQAIANGLIPETELDDLIELVETENDIAVFRPDMFGESNSQAFIEWFLTNNRC